MNIISIKEQFQIINGHIYIVNWGNQNVIVLDTYDYSTHTEAREMNKLEEELYEIFTANDKLCMRVVFPKRYENVEVLCSRRSHIVLKVQENGKYGLLFYYAYCNDYYRNNCFFLLAETPIAFSDAGDLLTWYNEDQCVGTYQKLSLERFKYYIVKNENLVGIYDSSGHEIVPCRFDNIKIEICNRWNSKELYYWVYCDTRVGIYGPSNSSIHEPYKEIVPCEYDKIEHSEIGYKVYKNGHAGLGEIVPCEFDDIELIKEFTQELVCRKIYKVRIGNHYGIYITLGNTSVGNIPCVFDKIELLEKSFKVCDGTHWGIFDSMGCELIPCTYEKIETLDSSYMVFNGTHWGIFSKNGNELTSCIYDEIKPIRGDYKVSSGIYCGILDHMGRERIPCEFHSIEHIINPSRPTFISPFYKVYNGECWGIYNISGSEIIPCLYDNIELQGVFFEVFKSGFCGLYNKDGLEFIPCIYERIEHFYDGYIVLAEKCIGIYNSDGKELIPCEEYDRIDVLYYARSYVPMDNMIYNVMEGLNTSVHDFSDMKIKDFYFRIHKYSKVGLYFGESCIVPCEYASIQLGMYNSYFHIAEVENSIWLLSKSVENKKIICDKIEEFTGDYWEHSDNSSRRRITCEKTYTIKAGGRVGLLYQHILIPSLYDKISPYIDEIYNLVYFKVSQNNKWGLFLGEEEICSCDYSDIELISGNIIILVKNGKKGFLNKTKEPTFPNCDDINFIIAGNAESQFYVMISRNGKWGLLDDSGMEIINPNYQTLTSCYWCSKQPLLFIVQTNGRWGVIDAKDNFRIPPIFDMIRIYGSAYYCYGKGVFYKINAKTSLQCELTKQEIELLSKKEMRNHQNYIEAIKLDKKSLGYVYDDLGLLLEYDCHLENLLK